VVISEQASALTWDSDACFSRRWQGCVLRSNASVHLSGWHPSFAYACSRCCPPSSGWCPDS